MGRKPAPDGLSADRLELVAEVPSDGTPELLEYLPLGPVAVIDTADGGALALTHRQVAALAGMGPKRRAAQIARWCTEVAALHHQGDSEQPSDGPAA